MIRNTTIFLITTTLLVSGQAFWKAAASQNSEANGLVDLTLKLCSNAFFLVGCIFYIVATALWMYLLSQYDYSKIYPLFVGTCIILSLVIGVVFFRENTGTIYRILGAALMMVGIVFVARS